MEGAPSEVLGVLNMMLLNLSYLHNVFQRPVQHPVFEARTEDCEIQVGVGHVNVAGSGPSSQSSLQVAIEVRASELCACSNQASRKGVLQHLTRSRQPPSIRLLAACLVLKIRGDVWDIQGLLLVAEGV